MTQSPEPPPDKRGTKDQRIGDRYLLEPGGFVIFVGTLAAHEERDKTDDWHTRTNRHKPHALFTFPFNVQEFIHLGIFRSKVRERILDEEGEVNPARRKHSPGRKKKQSAP
jgi:hypothetical protein